MFTILGAIKATLDEMGYDTRFDSRLKPPRLLLTHNGETLSLHVDDETMILEEWNCRGAFPKPLFSRCLADPEVVDDLLKVINERFRPASGQ